MVGQVAQALDRVGLHDAAIADDRHPVCALLDLGQDVAGEEDRRASLHSLAQGHEERLLDERVEPAGGLIEDEQLGPVLERDDHADLLLVALGVLLEAA